MVKLASDVIIVKHGQILLVKRNFEPFAGEWALPGGFVEDNETVEEAAVREAKEETGLDIDLKSIVGVLSDPNRDPRGRSVSIVFSAVPIGGEITTSRETREVKWFSIMDLPKLAFDHETILKKFVQYS